MPELEQKSFQRQVAYKVRVLDILNSKFMRDENNFSYIRLNNENMTRVNIIGIIVSKSSEQNYAGAIIDDGTGKIPLRSFESQAVFSNVEVGDTALVIGRVREFNNERYINAEIIRKIDAAWMSLRKIELAKIKPAEEIKDEKIKGEEAVDKRESVLSIIRGLDSGDGAAIEDVIKKSNDANAEPIVNSLLSSGEIFEIRPGKVKILE